MKFKDKDAPKDAGPEAAFVHMPWEASLKALASEGAYDLAGDLKPEFRGPDQPAAQTPAPGVAPVDGDKEVVVDGQTLTNMSLVTQGTSPGGLARDPAIVPVEAMPKIDPKPEPKGADKGKGKN